MNHTAAANSARNALSLADLKLTLQKLRAMPAEPIGEWMRMHDMPPDSWSLVLPAKLQEDIDGPVFWPDYVKFSALVDHPVFVRRLGELIINSLLRGEKENERNCRHTEV